MFIDSPCFPVCLFDLDGTLVDSLPGIAHSFGAALREVLPSRAEPDLRPFIGPPIRDIFRAALGQDVTTAELDALESVFRRSYDEDGWLRTVPYPGVLDGLATLAGRGVTCYIVTNKPMLPTRRILDHLGVSRHFQEVVTRESRTPPFSTKLEATRDLSCRLPGTADQTLFVGDSLDDAEAAHACGFYFAAADYGFGQVSSRATTRIHFRLSAFSALLSLPKHN